MIWERKWSKHSVHFLFVVLRKCSFLMWFVSKRVYVCLRWSIGFGLMRSLTVRYFSFSKIECQAKKRWKKKGGKYGQKKREKKMYIYEQKLVHSCTLFRDDTQAYDMWVTIFFLRSSNLIWSSDLLLNRWESLEKHDHRLNRSSSRWCGVVMRRFVLFSHVARICVFGVCVCLLIVGHDSWSGNWITNYFVCFITNTCVCE